MRIALFALSFLFICAGFPAFAQMPTGLVVPVDDAEMYISVKQYGAVGDGVADDTEAFQQALADTRESKKTVHVPVGSYRITQTLELKAQTLMGAPAAAWVSDESPMPEIIMDVADGPCVRLQAGGSVHGLFFKQDWKGEEPAPRGAAIELAGVGPRVTDVKIHNAWDGIMADGKSNVGRSYIENIFIVEVHNVGVRMMGTWDVSWISKVEVWSPNSSHFFEKGVGFLIGMNDMLLMSNCFVFRAQHGYLFVETIPGTEIEGKMWGTMSNCTADFCAIGMEIDGGHTVSIAGGTFWTHWTALRVKGEGGQVRLSGLEMKSNGGPTLDFEGGKYIAISGSQFRREMARFDQPALRITGAAAVAATGNIFTSTSDAVYVEDGLENIVIESNVILNNVVIDED